MGADLARLLGGLGLFLLGMTVMTEGLRALAGESLNRVLFRFTRSPLTGAVSGAAATAVLQSSSATTVATVGFVSAGLMTFDQALGILFGANIGTTVTGWMVALLGFKLALGEMMLPALLVGVMLRLFGRGRVSHVGWAVSGFALIFVGIDQMQAGMSAAEGWLTPATFPEDTWAGRLTLVLLGVAITLVTQSSSAGVATAIMAVNAGAISFSQAAALVIGMDVGTTSTAALAVLGGSPPTRRTGFAHVVYNLFTGLAALLLLTPYVTALDRWLGGTAASPELALVGFHTTFNTLGVLAVLPFTRRFARLMERLVPDRGPRLTRRLEPALLADASAAALALRSAVRDLAAETFTLVSDRLQGAVESPSDSERRAEVERAVAEARRYADRIRVPADERAAQRSHLAALHCLDHLDRLVDRAAQQRRSETTRDDPRLARHGDELRGALGRVVEELRLPGAPVHSDGLRAVRDALSSARQPYREATLAQVGAELGLDDAIDRLDAVRWLRRTAYHAWRITRHLAAGGPTGAAGSDEELDSRSELDPATEG